MTGEEIDDQVEARLHGVSQRYTSGRRRLVAALQHGDGPLTIKQIAQADESLPQSSIYRNLTLLEEAGVVSRIVTNDDFARYELAEALTQHHHHLICIECGDVVDFELDGAIETALDNALDRVARQAGFEPVNHRLDLLGSCGDCADDEAASTVTTHSHGRVHSHGS